MSGYVHQRKLSITQKLTGAAFHTSPSSLRLLRDRLLQAPLQQKSKFTTGAHSGCDLQSVSVQVSHVGETSSAVKSLRDPPLSLEPVYLPASVKSVKESYSPEFSFQESTSTPASTPVSQAPHRSALLLECFPASHSGKASVTRCEIATIPVQTIPDPRSSNRSCQQSSKQAGCASTGLTKDPQTTFEPEQGPSSVVHVQSTSYVSTLPGRRPLGTGTCNIGADTGATPFHISLFTPQPYKPENMSISAKPPGMFFKGCNDHANALLRVMGSDSGEPALQEQAEDLSQEAPLTRFQSFRDRSQTAESRQGSVSPTPDSNQRSTSPTPYSSKLKESPTAPGWLHERLQQSMLGYSTVFSHCSAYQYSYHSTPKSVTSATAAGGGLNAARARRRAAPEVVSQRLRQFHSLPITVQGRTQAMLDAKSLSPQDCLEGYNLANGRRLSCVQNTAS